MLKRWVPLFLLFASMTACNGDDDLLETPECGNTVVEAGELCDDGNTDETDSCTTDCLIATCGDGFVYAAYEQCDDGLDNGDTRACTSRCRTNVCGDGLPGPDEQCDDGNRDDSDYCRSDCTHASCGDGVVQGDEACDDGNSDAFDGCHTCRVEPSWYCSAAGCECVPGHTGPRCGSCLPGWQDDDGDGACEMTCDLLASTAPCAAGASCELVNGSPTCTCDDGFFGEDCQPLAACTIFVALDGTGDGTSWATARGDLQGAIDAAAVLAAGRADATCDVWAKTGKYRIGGGLPTDSLMLAEGVRVYGGFQGTESAPDQRERESAHALMTWPSVLQGDGVRHVVTAASRATLDGFTITGGYADGNRSGPDGRGAGLLADEAEDLLLEAVEVRDNVAQAGGGIAILGGSVTLRDVRIQNNQAGWDGGGLHIDGVASLLIDNSWIVGNETLNGHGGALAATGVAHLRLVESTVSANEARWDGGGLHVVDSGLIELEGSRLVGQNPSDGSLGGGGFFEEVEHVLLIDTHVTGNHTRYEGAGLYLRGVDRLEVIGGGFEGNFAGPWTDSEGGIGGAFAGYGVQEVVLSDTILVGNEATWRGGGIALFDVGDIDVRGVLFDGNRATTDDGGALLAEGATRVYLEDALFAANQSYTEGAALMLEGFLTLEVQGGTFASNVEEGYAPGGAIFLHGSRNVSDATFEGTDLHGNTTNGSASVLGAHFLRSLALRDLHVWDNSNSTNSGGNGDYGSPVYTRFVNDLFVEDSVFEGNGLVRSLGAGAMHNVNFRRLTVRGSTFRDHKFERSTAPVAVLKNCNDVSDLLGVWKGTDPCREPTWDRDGAQPTEAFDSTVVIEDTVFEYNDGYYSDMHFSNEFIDTVVVRRSKFLDGRANFGAALECAGCRDLHVEHTTFDRNHSRYTSTDIYMGPPSGWYDAETEQGVERSLTVSDSTFSLNRGSSSVRLEYIDTVDFQRSTFVGTMEPTDDDDWFGWTHGWAMNGEGAGGAIAISESREVLIEDSSFDGYGALSGGAIKIDSDGSMPFTHVQRTGDVAVRRSVFTNNVAQYGGALAVMDGAALTVEDCTFQDNTVWYPGGGLSVETYDTVDVRGSSFVGNASRFTWGEGGPDYGVSGGAHFIDVPLLTLEDTTFEGNVSQGVAGSFAAVKSWQNPDPAGSVTLRRVTSSGSSLQGIAPGFGYVGGGAQIELYDHVTIEDSRFTDADCPSPCVGGGVYVYKSNNVTVARTLFGANRTGSATDQYGAGAGLALYEVNNARVDDSIFADNVVNNTGFYSQGGAIAFRPSFALFRPNLRIQGSTFLNNAAATVSTLVVDHEVIGDATPTLILVENSLIRDQSDAQSIRYFDTSWSPIDTFDLGYSNIDGRAGQGTAVTDEDPLLQAESSSDPLQRFRPASGSPLLEAGLVRPEGATDFEGTLRGDPPTIGALE